MAGSVSGSSEGNGIKKPHPRPSPKGEGSNYRRGGWVNKSRGRVL